MPPTVTPGRNVIYSPREYDNVPTVEVVEVTADESDDGWVKNFDNIPYTPIPGPAYGVIATPIVGRRI